jgi:hypothetical protein
MTDFGSPPSEPPPGPASPPSDPWREVTPTQPSSPYADPPYAPFSPQPTPGSPAIEPLPPYLTNPSYISPYGPTAAYPPSPQVPEIVYAVPGWPVMVVAPKNRFATSGMVVSLSSLPFTLCCAVVGLIGGVVGLIFGVLGLQKSAAMYGSGRGFAITGVAVGVADVVLVILNYIVLFKSGLYPQLPPSQR